MANLTQNRPTIQEGDRTIADRVNPPVAAGVILFGGAMVAIAGAGSPNAGFCQKVIVPTPAGGLTIIGRSDRQYDNSGSGVIAGSGNGTAGNINASVLQGVFKWDNGIGGDVLTAADIGFPCFASDDHTVNRTDSAGTRPYAGIVQSVDPDGVWVEQRQSLRKTGQVLTITVDLASMAAGVYQKFVPGFRGCIERFEYMPGKAATTAAKLATVTPRITPTGGAAAVVTGGVLALTTVNTAIGANVASSTITALNQFGETDTVDLFVSGLTAFVEGFGTFLLYLA